MTHSPLVRLSPSFGSPNQVPRMEDEAVTDILISTNLIISILLYDRLGTSPNIVVLVNRPRDGCSLEPILSLHSGFIAAEFARTTRAESPGSDASLRSEQDVTTPDSWPGQ